MAHKQKTLMQVLDAEGLISANYKDNARSGTMNGRKGL